MSRFAVGLCLLAASLALEPATAQQSAANTMPRNPSFTATLSNTTPLVFGMDVEGVSRALGQPLSYISGRAGDEIYLAPYGWMPVDPYMGIYAMQHATTLNTDQRRQIRDFYFGGLDYYRMAANSDHNQTLTPAKESMRSDDVDFQRGELEWGNHNIYFDKYKWQLEWKELKTPPVD